MQAYRQYCNTTFWDEIPSMSDEEFKEFQQKELEEDMEISAERLQDVLGKLAISGDASATVYTMPTCVSPIPICYCIPGV